MIALTVALAVPVVQTAMGRTGGFEVVRFLWDAVSQPSEARAAPKPIVRALAVGPSLGPLEAAPVSAFPVSIPPAPHILR
jgi:hypothetical protein